MNHTPTPWMQEEGWILSEALSERVAVCDETIGETRDNRDANAKFIVKACNNFDGLIDFVRTVASGNTEYDDLVAMAERVLKNIERRSGKAA